MKTDHDRAVLQAAVGQPPVLRSLHARGRVAGLLLSMTLSQVYRNEGPDNLEVTYTFPLPWGAVLLGLEATLGGERMTGRVTRRQEARETYEQAIEAGDAPVMVEKSERGVYSASLGSLKPGEEAVLELHYAQLLGIEQGRVRLVVPTTLAPRYGDAVVQGGLLPHQAAAPDLLAEHGFGLELEVTGVLAGASISCPTHGVSQRHAEGAVTVAVQGKAWMDRDFVLLLEGLQGRSLAVMGADAAAGEGRHAVIASWCYALPATRDQPLHLKLLVDCSGSMGGTSIAQARGALHALASELGRRDWITYSRFGTETEHLLAATCCQPDGVRRLARAIEQTDADLGGTEMHAALAQTFDLKWPCDDDVPAESDVLLITDGAVWDAQRLVDAAERSGHRIFALGVGSAPSESLLRELAESTGGRCEFVSPAEDMAAAVQRLLSHMRHACPLNLHIDTDRPVAWGSRLPGRLLEGETVHAHLRLEGRPTQAPALAIDGDPPHASRAAPRTTAPAASSSAASLLRPEGLEWIEGDLVARLVAAREVAATADAAQAAALAEKYQLVTEHTNLLLVFERAEADKTDGMPALHQVRPMLAAGWGGTAPRMRFGIDRRTTDVVAEAFSAFAPMSFAMSADFLLDLGDEPSDPADGVLVSAFNAAVRPGLSFRQVLRAIVGLPEAQALKAPIERAAAALGSVARAWASYLLWRHQGGADGETLSSEALALVQQQLARVDAKALAKVQRGVWKMHQFFATL